MGAEGSSSIVSAPAHTKREDTVPGELCTPPGPGGLFSSCVHISPTALSHLPFLQPQPTSSPCRTLQAPISLTQHESQTVAPTDLPMHPPLLPHLGGSFPGTGLDIYLWLSFPRRPFPSVLWRETLPCFHLLTTFLPEIKTILSVPELACHPPPSVSFQVPGTQ